MKKFTVFLFFAALAALYAGNASAQTAVEIPSHPLDGYTPEQIFTSGDTFTRTLNFDNSTVEYQGKGFFYSFTLAEPAVITYSSTPHIVSELSYIYPRATLLTNLTGYGYNEHGEIQLYDNPETTVLGTGTHYMVVFVDDYQPGTTLTVSFSKAVLPVTPLALPCDTTLTMAQGEEKYYSFTLTEPATPEVTFPDFTTSPEYGESLAWNIRNESLLREFAYGYCSADGTKQQDTRLLPAGKYYFILNANVNNPFRLKITPQIPAAITLPYDQNITMQPDENKVMQFTLAEECLVALSEATTEGSGDIDLIDSEDNSVNFLFIDRGYGQVINELLSAGTYYVSMKTYDESLTVNLNIKTINTSAVPSYTTTDCSEVLPKGTLVSGTLNGDNLRYYSIGEGDKSERYYSLIRGFTLAVEKGNEYTFSGISKNTELLVLRNGTLTGNIYTDMLAVNEFDGNGGAFTYTATKTGSVRILVVSRDGVESGAYTLKVTEKTGSAPIITIAELCAQAAELTYSTSLSQTLQIDLNASTPRIQAEYTAPEENEDEISHLEWIGHAKAYKINIPENNSGISIDAGYNPVFIYRKTGNEYEQLLLIDESDDLEIPAEYAGEWYMVCMNIPFAPVSAYTLDIWVTDKPQSSGTTLKTLLDNTTAVTLPYSGTGNTAADGTAVSDLDEYIDASLYRSSKTTARKITVTEDYQTLYVRSNFSYMALLEIDDNEPDSPDSKISAIFRRLRTAKAAGDDYRTLNYGWGGNMEYSVSKGDYWVIGIMEEGDADYRLQISVSQPEVITFTAIAANTQSIGVNENASETEIKAVLSLLKLTATLTGSNTMKVENRPEYWVIASGGQQATLNYALLLIRNFNHLSFDDATALAADIAPLVIQIKYTGNDVPDGIAGTESAKLTVYTAGSRITVNGMEAGTLWQLFDISGKPAAQGKASGSTLEIDAPQRGIYIFRAGAKALKTVVK